MIQPFEKSILGEIEKAIFKADLGLAPANDGQLIRVPVPALTEDRRKDIVKNLKKIAEEAKVALRQVRRDANDDIKKSEKSKELTEDDSKRLQTDIQKLTDKFIKQIDDKVAVKEKEVMKV